MRLLRRLAWMIPLAAVATSCGEGSGKRPNLILISIDSLRADHLGCYGYDRDTSPTLDRLAEEGTRFVDVIAESSWTLPTHITMLTGLSSPVHRVTTDSRRLTENHETLAEVLRARGYRTRGLWSGTYLHPLFGLGQGFDEGDYEGVIGDLVFDEEAFDPSKPKFARQRMKDMQTAITAVTSPVIIDKANAFLDGVGDEPFFLFLHMFDVHFDYNPPEADWRRFDPDYDGEFTGENLPFNEAIHAGMPARDLQHLIARYDGEIYFTDREIGRLIDHLDRLGLSEDTVVAVTADHGDEFFEHGDKGHQKTLYDEVVRVPWIVRQPGTIPADRVVEEQTRHVDQMPTLLGLLGIPHSPNLMGDDLAPVVMGNGEARERTAVSRLHGRVGQVSAMRTTRWKLVTSQPREGHASVEYYDLTEDPSELSTIAPQEGRVQEALQKLTEFGKVERTLRSLLGTSEGGSVDLPPELAKQLKELGY